MKVQVKTKFIVDKEKRTVVCIMTVYNDVCARLDKYHLDYDLFYDLEEVGPHIYRGVAKCAPEDEWDETYGKQLAEYRAACARRADVNKKLYKFVTQTVHNLNQLCIYGILKPPHKPVKENFHQMTIDEIDKK